MEAILPLPLSDMARYTVLSSCVSASSLLALVRATVRAMQYKNNKIKTDWVSTSSHKKAFFIKQTKSHLSLIHI